MKNFAPSRRFALFEVARLRLLNVASSADAMCIE